MSMGTVAADHTGFQVFLPGRQRKLVIIQVFVGERNEFPVMRERSVLVR